MRRFQQQLRWLSQWEARATLAACALVLLIVYPAQLQAQTFTVLHAFEGPADDGFPLSGLIMDAHGNLYGATPGAAYKLTRRGSGWTYAELWTQGTNIQATPLLASDGSLFVSDAGGGPNNSGQIIHLQPPANVCASVNCPWTGTVIHTFGGVDGSFPTNITFDSSGNIYGTTVEGGAGKGVVYKLTNNHGSWTYSTVTNFVGTRISAPGDGVVLDQSGNFYGTSILNPGQIFKVTSTGQASVIYQFECCANGVDTLSGLLLDNQGNLYGTTEFEGPVGNGGTAYELSPSGNGWTLTTLQGFPGIIGNGVVGTSLPLMDAQGNLYGTSTWGGNNGYGLVYKLTRTANGWAYTDLHEFSGGDDGCYPWDGMVMDSSGNLYGTASQCGQYGGYQEGGTLWEITP